MTPALQLQGRVFCGLALAVVVASLAGARLAPRYELLAAAALVLLLGMPHGAFDVVVARRLFGIADVKAWALFALFYVGLSAAVVGVWFVAPTFFLGAFLVFSALHFGGDPASRASGASGTSSATRGLYGGAVIVLPALLHGPELERLLGLVAGPASASVVAPVLSQLAAAWLGATVLACALQARTSRLAACEAAALAALSITAPPLVAFTVYFCAMHSPRHILRTLASLRSGADHETSAPSWPVAAQALWPALAVLATAACVGWLAGDVPVEARVMQLVFVGLAALTLPHMVLLALARGSAATGDR